jgi:hypothetical protein
LGWDELWWCVQSLGLGLSDDEIHALQVSRPTPNPRLAPGTRNATAA